MAKYVLAWLPLVVIAVLNGVVRQAVYSDALGELRAHQLSTVTGVLLFGLYIWFLMRRQRPGSPRQALAVGFMWLGMTVAFEFLFMHYALGRPWEVLLHDYNLLEGRVWVVILIWVTTAPYLFYRLQK